MGGRGGGYSSAPRWPPKGRWIGLSMYGPCAGSGRCKPRCFFRVRPYAVGPVRVYSAQLHKAARSCFECCCHAKLGPQPPLRVFLHPAARRTSLAYCHRASHRPVRVAQHVASLLAAPQRVLPEIMLRLSRARRPASANAAITAAISPCAIGCVLTRATTARWHVSSSCLSPLAPQTVDFAPRLFVRSTLAGGCGSLSAVFGAVWSGSGTPLSPGWRGGSGLVGADCAGEQRGPGKRASPMSKGAAECAKGPTVASCVARRPWSTDKLRWHRRRP